MSLAATVKAMAAAGCSAEQIAEVVSKIDEERRAKSRAGNAARQKRWRERNADNAVIQRDDALQPVIRRDEPLAYKDKPRADALVSNGSSLRSEPVSLELKPNPSDLSKAGRKPPSRKSALAEDAQPSDAARLLAQEAGLSSHEFRDEWRAFRDHHCSRGNLMKNWDLAWSTWLRKSKQFKARAGPSRSPKENPFLADWKKEMQERQVNGSPWKFDEQSDAAETGTEGVIDADYSVIG